MIHFSQLLNSFWIYQTNNIRNVRYIPRGVVCHKFDCKYRNYVWYEIQKYINTINTNNEVIETSTIGFQYISILSHGRFITSNYSTTYQTSWSRNELRRSLVPTNLLTQLWHSTLKKTTLSHKTILLEATNQKFSCYHLKQGKYTSLSLLIKKKC